MACGSTQRLTALDITSSSKLLTTGSSPTNRHRQVCKNRTSTLYCNIKLDKITTNYTRKPISAHLHLLQPKLAQGLAAHGLQEGLEADLDQAGQAGGLVEAHGAEKVHALRPQPAQGVREGRGVAERRPRRPLAGLGAGELGASFGERRAVQNLGGKRSLHLRRYHTRAWVGVLPRPQFWYFYSHRPIFGWRTTNIVIFIHINSYIMIFCSKNIHVIKQPYNDFHKQKGSYICI